MKEALPDKEFEPVAEDVPFDTFCACDLRAVKVLTCELAMRFLTDYIDGDLYFRVRSPEHNLIRARTQFKLVKEIEDKMDELNAIVREIAGR